MKTQAIVFPRPFAAELAEIELRPLQPGEVLTRTVYTGVSTGTEVRVYSGKQINTTFPLIPGYENVGEVVEVAAGTTLKVGDYVYGASLPETAPYCRSWGGQVEYAVSPESSLIALPRGMDLLKASFAHTAAIGFHGLRRARVARGETVAIVGQGLIGFLAGLSARALGARVVAIDHGECGSAGEGTDRRWCGCCRRCHRRCRLG